MNKVQTLKNRIRQRLGLNYVAYMGNPECNEDWLKGYDQAKFTCRILMKIKQN